jgi:hypothetical protein
MWDSTIHKTGAWLLQRLPWPGVRALYLQYLLHSFLTFRPVFLKCSFVKQWITLYFYYLGAKVSNAELPTVCLCDNSCGQRVM